MQQNPERAVGQTPRVEFPRVKRPVENQSDDEDKNAAMRGRLMARPGQAGDLARNHARPDSRRNLADSSGGVGLM